MRLTRTAAGVADQIVSSASNYFTAFLASLVLLPTQFGPFVLAFAVVTVLLAAARALVGEPLLAHLPMVAPARQAPLASSALGGAVVLGLLGAVVCVVGGLSGTTMLTALLAFAPWMPFALAADAARFVLLARGDTVRALAVDGVWAAVQLLALGVVWFVGSWSVALLAMAWGVGALGALVCFAATTRERPGHPGPWWAESRYLSGWFTLTTVLGQVHIYLVLLLAGFALTAVDTAGLRAVQLLVFQPAITLMAALLVLITPVMSRLSAAGDTVALHRARRTAMTAMAAVGVVVLLAIPLGDVLLGALFPRYIDYAPLVAPIAVQTAIAALTVPFHAQIRGYRRGRTLFVQTLLQAVLLLAGAGTGLVLGGVLGLAWGLAVAMLVGLAAMAAASSRLSPAPVGERTAVAEPPSSHAVPT